MIGCVDERLDAFGMLNCSSLVGVASGDVDTSEAERVNDGVRVLRAVTFLSGVLGKDYDASACAT